LVIEKPKHLTFMQQGQHQMNTGKAVAIAPEARYAYYRRCQVFRGNGEQCKAPAEKGEQICHAHATQQATALRRERERQAVLAEAVAEMRWRGRLEFGKHEFEAKDLFTDFRGIQVTIAKMAQALIDGRIDCKTAGRLAVDLQMMSKLLWLAHRQRQKTLPRMNTDNTDLTMLPNIELLEGKAESPKHRSEPVEVRDISDERTDHLTVGAKVLTFPKNSRIEVAGLYRTGQQTRAA
jgi:hypothetical protein